MSTWGVKSPRAILIRQKAMIDGVKKAGLIYGLANQSTADYLYQNVMMSNASAHDYLYNSILRVTNSLYERKDFKWNDSLIGPSK